jgi:hypothetical protein
LPQPSFNLGVIRLLIAQTNSLKLTPELIGQALVYLWTANARALTCAKLLYPRRSILSAIRTAAKSLGLIVVLP